MLLEALWRKNIYAILNEMIKAGYDTYFSAGELSTRLKISKPTLIEGLNILRAFGIVDVTKKTENKEYFKLAEISPLLPIITELIETAQEYDTYITRNLLTYIDNLLYGRYYIGMFWAAFQNVEPIDYHPQIFVIYTQKPKLILPFAFLDSVYVGLCNKWYPDKDKEILVGVVPINELPIDVSRLNFFEFKVSMTSIERGIAQCFSSTNVFYPPYASALAFVQNYELKRINEKVLKQVALEEGSLEVLKAVAYYVEKRTGKGYLTALNKEVTELKDFHGSATIVWGQKHSEKAFFEVGKNKFIALDVNTIENAIRTVFG